MRLAVTIAMATAALAIFGAALMVCDAARQRRRRRALKSFLASGGSRTTEIARDFDDKVRRGEELP